ncbi:MAG TPA: hypothetical protein VF958_07490, partial [Thermoanaerobaculia bacterium]
KYSMDHETVEEIKRHFNVVAEGLRSDIRLVIEGLAANTDRLDGVDVRLDGIDVRLDRLETGFDGFESRVAAEFTETRAMVRLSYGELERRIERFEGRGG